MWRLTVRHFVAAFIYNRQHSVRLLTNGWVLAGSAESEDRARRALGITAAPPRD